MPRNTKLLIAAALMLGIGMAGGAAAGRLSGQQLLSLCTANMNGRGNPMAAAECLGFVVGVADTFDCEEAEHGLRWNSSVNISQPRIVQIVVQHIEQHPTDLMSGGHYVVAHALAEAFPCPSKTAGN